MNGFPEGSAPKSGPFTLPTIGQVMLELAAPTAEHYRRDPVTWASEKLGVHLWSKQREIIESVRDHRKTVVHSCHESGKSFSAATVVAHWIDTYPPGEAFALTTAPTGDQVAAILWREINRMHSSGDLPGRMNLTEWYIGKELVALGRKPSDYNPHAFQGIHAPFLLVVFDEACGITRSMWDSASTLAANENSRWLAIGNPDDANTEFGKVCKPDSDWNVIQIDCEDTPNFTGEPVPKRVSDSLIHPIWVQDRAKHWGVDSALYQSKCRGQFPTAGDPYQAVPFAWAQACRHLELTARGDIEAGIDFGAGSDRTVIWIRQGPRALGQHVFVDPDPMRQVGNIAAILKERGVRRVKGDVIGIGWGVVGRLRELSSRSNPYGRGHTHDAEVIGVNVAEDPPPGAADPDRFANLRAWLYWEVGRELSRLKGWDLSQVDDDTIHELTIARYKIVDSSGRILIEPKKEIIKRVGKSPDSSDALLLAFMPGTPEGSTAPSGAMDRDLLSGTSPRDLTGERAW